MKKVVTLVLLVVIPLFLVQCRKKHPIPEVEPIESIQRARPGPGFSWGFSTTDQENPAEYKRTADSRQYYLKESAGYKRSLTLTITKKDTLNFDLAFRIYSKQWGCLTTSAPTVSMGTTSTTNFVVNGAPATYAGYTWSVPLSKSAIGTTATLTEIVSGASANCTEGSLYADLIAPYLITATNSFDDGDNIGFVRNDNL